jgi:hypothetical protein
LKILNNTQKLIIWLIDIGFIVYWSLIIFRVFPPELLFERYEKSEVQAWNWSFLPLDLAAALTGIAGNTLKRVNQEALIIASLVLTSVAGGMALAYWTVLGYFDLWWWLPNLILLLFPLWPLNQIFFLSANESREREQISIDMARRGKSK